MKNITVVIDLSVCQVNVIGKGIKPVSAISTSKSIKSSEASLDLDRAGLKQQEDVSEAILIGFRLAII